ncbi:hypothetical protein D3C72_1786990 [compost metagenome]
MTPSLNVPSKARLTDSLAAITAICENPATMMAAPSASSMSLSKDTTRLTSPARSASIASIMRPVNAMSMAFDLPTARGKRCVPPAPGITPSLISGWPNLAVSDAMMKSHIIASSQPPPSAKPLTAAITGLRMERMASQLRVM